MGRVIKFRVWNTYNERMVIDPYRFRENTDQPADDIRFNAPWQYVEDWQDDDDGVWRPCHVMQFTGLLDKDRKKIYEGDIVRGPNGKHWVIEWIGHSWSMTNTIIPNGPMKFGGEETYTIDKWLMLPPIKQSLEIVGNIYDDPELIVKK